MTSAAYTRTFFKGKRGNAAYPDVTVTPSDKKDKDLDCFTLFCQEDAIFMCTSTIHQYFMVTTVLASFWVGHFSSSPQVTRT